MCSHLLAKQFSSMFHAKCLLPRLDELLHVRSCLQNFYQCYQYHYDYHWKNYNAPPFMLIKCKNLMKFMNFKLPSCPEQTQISILFHKKSPQQDLYTMTWMYCKFKTTLISPNTTTSLIMFHRKGPLQPVVFVLPHSRIFASMYLHGRKILGHAVRMLLVFQYHPSAILHLSLYHNNLCLW